jgi:dTDP-4-amino-4,6-dideoxygalactose transaminase
MQPEAPWGQSTHWLSCLTIDPKIAGVTREQVRLALEAENIEARPAWKPMHLQPVFAQAEMHGGPVSERLFDQGLCLPSGAGMKEEERARVIAVTSKVIKR